MRKVCSNPDNCSRRIMFAQRASGLSKARTPARFLKTCWEMIHWRMESYEGRRTEVGPEAGGGRPERRVRGREWVGVAEADAGHTSARQRRPCCPSGLGSCGLLIEIWFRLCPPLELCALKPPRLPCPAAPSALARPAAVSASGTPAPHLSLLPASLVFCAPSGSRGNFSTHIVKIYCCPVGFPHSWLLPHAVISSTPVVQ